MDYLIELQEDIEKTKKKLQGFVPDDDDDTTVMLMECQRLMDTWIPKEERYSKNNPGNQLIEEFFDWGTEPEFYS